MSEMPKRFTGQDAGPFYGCVDKDGYWFDSANSFEVAVHWCACFVSAFDLTTGQEMEWMSTQGKDLGFSVVHSDMLRKMWAAGLIN